jgi:hypothetical protein
VALSETDTALLAELVDNSYEETASSLTGALAGLSAEAVAAVEGQLANILTEYTTVRNKHLRVAGGRDGVDLDYERNRAALRERARTALKVSGTSDMPTFFTAARGCRGR